MREVRLETLMKAQSVVPEGEHWLVEVVMKGEVKVSKGAKLTVLETLMKAKVIVENGGELDVRGVNMKSEIVYEPSVTQELVACKSCRAAIPSSCNFCGFCGYKIK